MRTSALMMLGTALLMIAATRDLIGRPDKPQHDEGSRLFRKEMFGGNGRTCETCHSRGTGTISPDDVREILKTDPGNPLFRHDGLDDGFFGTSRITEHATIRVERPLPPNVKIAGNPSATSVILLRGVPTTINTPALDPALMYDLRASTLEDQAHGAIHDHAQNTVEPSFEDLQLIADFQRTDAKFFSSAALRNFANGGPPPELPEGNSASEKRGRLMFIETAFTPGSTEGICALCHSGPMLNRTSPFNQGAPPGARIANIGVSERNLLNLPEYTFLIDNGFGDVRRVTMPDLGIPLTNPRPPGVPPPTVRHPAFFAGMFKIPSLWGVKKTAPYFHDNSVKTLEELALFYADMFATSQEFPVQLTPQDRVDMVAFLRLLQ